MYDEILDIFIWITENVLKEGGKKAISQPHPKFVLNKHLQPLTLKTEIKNCHPEFFSATFDCTF